MAVNEAWFSWDFRLRPSGPPMLTRFSTFLRERLRTGPGWRLTLWATLAAFATYFCMYAFRKPFAVGSWSGEGVWDSDIQLKTTLVVAQIVGYATSKLVGIKFCSESNGNSRARLLVGLILMAEFALVLLPFLPRDASFLAMFLNGLPLGMVWGLVVSYLEGRRSSEVLMAGLSVSFIVSSGAVKDVGLWFMHSGVTEGWMPAVTGLAFLPLFLVAVWMLEVIPAPSDEDIRDRSPRTAMDGNTRKQFLLQYGSGLAALILTYVLLTGYRDYRDNFGVEILFELGVGESGGVFSRTELPIALLVLGVMAALSWIRSNTVALAVTMTLVAIGCAMPWFAGALRNLGVIGPMTWMLLAGFGCYLAYVPFNSVLFDRLMAHTRAPGNAVFAIYLADTGGYIGVIALLIVSDRLASNGLRLAFLDQWGLVLALVGPACLLFSTVFFGYRTGPQRHSESSPVFREHL